MSVDSTLPDDATAIVRATSDLPPTDALAAFTDSEQIARWFWPARFETHATGTLADRGVLRVRSDVVGIGFTATVTDERPGSGITCLWQWDEDETVTTVDVEVTGRDNGSSVIVTHGGNPTTQARDDHDAGWRSCLERFEAYPG